MPCIPAIGALLRRCQRNPSEGQMLRITWDTNGEVVFKVSGRLDAESVGDLEALFGSEANGRRIVLNLLELTLVRVGNEEYARDNGYQVFH